MAVKFLNDVQAKEIISSGEKLVLNFYADWCGPCRMFAPILEELSEKTTVIKINVDSDKALAQELGVQGIPSTFVFNDKKVVEKFVGYVPKEVVEEKL